MSSLRAEEKFEQAKKVLKKAYEILARLGLENTEVELLVISWCKIKRDLARQKNDYLKKTTIVDFLPIHSSCVFQFLFEELKTFSSFRSESTVNHMFDDMFQCISRLESLPTDDPLIKSRVYLEIAQFELNDSEGVYKDHFKL